MPFVHGKGAAVYFNEINVSPYLNSASLSASNEPADTTTFGSTWKTAIAGLSDATFSAGGFYDPALLELDTELGVDSGVLTYLPGGATAIGDSARMLLVSSTAVERSSSTGEAVAISWEAQSESSALVGTLLHPLAEDTNTTTGAERDDAAATATGWTAHLHVTAVDGGSWVIKLQDAAVSNTYSDVTGGAFTAATGATSQRLTSAASTTALRRYVRYVATRTSGTAGDGITFALIYSRSTV